MKAKTGNIQHPMLRARVRREWLDVGGAVLGLGCFSIPKTIKTQMKLAVYLLLCLSAFTLPAADPSKPMTHDSNQTEIATVAGGCFWCTEAVFERLPGVLSVSSGYTGGQTESPTYEQVCTGGTGHAEAIQITFDPAKITYAKLLETFWDAHDPTTLNRQGADRGTQYRSAIFYSTEAQRLAAEKSKATAAKNFSSPIVTEIVPLKKYFKAEGYHQGYFRNNPTGGYCRMVIKPKLDKLDQKHKPDAKDAKP